MLTSGAFITAARAAELGLINHAVPGDTLADETQALARTVAAKLGSAVRIGKRAFYEQLELPLSAAYAHTGAVMVENMAHPDTAEGIDAFLQKRPPRWAQ